MKSKDVLALGLFLFLFVVIFPISSLAAYYVATASDGGNDSTGDGSSGKNGVQGMGLLCIVWRFFSRSISFIDMEFLRASLSKICLLSGCRTLLDDSNFH